VIPTAFDLLYCSLLGIGVKKLFDQGLTACMVTSDQKGDINPLYMKDVEDENGRVMPRLVDINSQKSEMVFRNNLHFIHEADYEVAKNYVSNPEEFDFLKILNWN
jgi:6-phosphofructokinase 1